MLRDFEIEQIQTVFKEYIDSKYIAGGNMMVIKNGETVFYHEEGYADLDKRTSICRDTIFRLYSMTKPITAAAVMILMERGKLDLYDPVSKYIKGFKNQKVVQEGELVPAEREVSIKDLLSMTSGLVYGGEGLAGKETESLFSEIVFGLNGDNPMTTYEIADRLGKCPLAFQPGTNWEYGASADVLGAIVEIISGKKFSVFLEEEIFAPLKMTDTGFFVPQEKRFRLSSTYADNGNGGLEIYKNNHLGINQKMDKLPAFESGGAGLVSTIDDYAKFANMLMQGGSCDGVKILKPKTVQYLTTATLTPRQETGLRKWNTMCGYSYGNLMRVMTDCTKAGDFACMDEYGWDGWLGAYFINCPREKVTFLFMIQKTDSGTNEMTRKLRNIVLSGL